jgi:PAS domain S-box-containing protein
MRDEQGNIYGVVMVFRDITSRRQAEAAQLHLAAIIDSSDDAIISKTLEGKIKSWNKAAERIFGYPEAEAVGKSICLIIPPELSWEEEEILGRLKRGERIDHYETRRKKKDGTLIDVSLTISPIRNKEGNLIGASKIVRDITERRQSENLLRESEERHRLAHDAGQIGTWDWEIIHNHVAWSDIVYKFHGLKPGEFSGKVEDFAAIVHPDDRDRVKAAINAALANNDPYSIEARLVWPNGEVHWISTEGKVFFDAAGKPARMIGATVEITERKRAEERQRLLWEAAGVLLTADNPDVMLHGIFSQVGRQFGLDMYFNYMVEEDGETLRLKSYTGLPTEEAERIGRLKFGQAVCGNMALRRVPIVVTSIQKSDDPMVRLVKGYGIRAYACNPLIAGDRLIGTLSFASLSKENFSGVELEFFETISRYVAIAYERLGLIERLRDADKRKDEFLAMLAHELRNPLAPVRNAVELLKHYGINDPKLQWPREIIARQVTQMTRLVDDLLDVSRITRGKISLCQEVIEIRVLVERALETSRPLVDAKGQQLTVTLPDEPHFVKGDTTRLAQILSNLINNAAKYSDAGGSIRLEVEKQWDEIVSRIQDNGVGISPDILPHIFDLFAQAERSLDRSQGGLGIGLTVVRRLVDMHGGRVVARSEGPNKGSEFTVYLPAYTGPPPEDLSAATQFVAPWPSSRRRILVMDDNLDSAESIALLMQYSGHEVRIADNVTETFRTAREFRPHIVLLDIGLPEMDGSQVARVMRQDPEIRNAVLIALTGYGRDEDRQRSKEAGFDHHFTKPVDPDALGALIDSLILD